MPAIREPNTPEIEQARMALEAARVRRYEDVPKLREAAQQNALRATASAAEARRAVAAGTGNMEALAVARRVEDAAKTAELDLESICDEYGKIVIEAESALSFAIASAWGPIADAAKRDRVDACHAAQKALESYQAAAVAYTAAEGVIRQAKYGGIPFPGDVPPPPLQPRHFSFPLPPELSLIMPSARSEAEFWRMPV